MLFGVVARMGLRMCLLDKGADAAGKGNFGGRYGVAHYNQWGICLVAVQEHVKRLSCCLGW